MPPGPSPNPRGVPASGTAGVSTAGRKVFRSNGALALWYVWLIFAVANLVDLAVQGRDHVSAVIAAVLVLITGVAYITALRPRIIADDDAVTLRNPLYDIRVPWGAVSSIELADVVRVHCQVESADPLAPPRARVLHSWALQSSRRTQVKAQRRAKARAARFAAEDPVFARLPEQARELATLPASAAAVAQLDEWRGHARERGAPGGNPVMTWSRASIAALLIPAALVAVVAAIG